MVSSKPATAQSQRLEWLEGIRILAAVMILLYHAQLLFTDYAYTPQPHGVLENLSRMLQVGEQVGISPIANFLSLPAWFGFQFVDVFVLISGFGLVLSLKGRPLETGQFLKHRLLRLLWPFWTVAWLSYPVLWIIGKVTRSYSPDPWHSFAGAVFPLTLDYRGSTLLSTSGPWWFVPLIISFTLVFPLLWHLLHRWGGRNLLWVSLVLTLAYRTFAVFWLGGHPTYVIMDTPAVEQPFQLFLSRLVTFVVGMLVAQSYQQGKGPLLWTQTQALKWGLLLYITGFVGQFYQWGWVIADLLSPLGLSLLGMVFTRYLCQFRGLKPMLLTLGGHSYSYFLIHNFVVDRTLKLVVQQDLGRYFLSIPLMVLGTLILAVLVDQIRPYLEKAVLYLWQSLDEFCTQT